MKRSIQLAALAILLLRIAVSPAQLQPPQVPMEGRIEGSVVRLGTGEAVTRARVTLMVAPPTGTRPTAAERLPVAAAVTDSQGKFSFPDLDEGAYLLQVNANGYVGLNFGQTYGGGPGTPVSLKPGQEMKGLVAQLTPAANVSGRIRDGLDQPLVEVPVQLMRYSYNASGQRSYQTVGIAKTNDRGEYRIYWITPGRYYLVAGSMEATPGSYANNNAVPNAMQFAIFPGVSDISLARVIELQPGADLDSVNMTLLPKPKTFHIRGRVIDSRTGKPPARAQLAASARTPGLAGALGGAPWMTPISTYNAATGAFEIRNLVPGNYVVKAAEPPASAVSYAIGAGQTSNPSSGLTLVTVADSNVEGVTVTILSDVEISGRLRVDSQLPLKLDRMRVHLTPWIPASYGLLISSGSRTVIPSADGTFRVTNVPLGEYRVFSSAVSAAYPTGELPESHTVYIKEVRYGGADVLNGPLILSGSNSGALDIVAGVGSGKVSGIVSDSRSAPVPVTPVVLVPDRSRNRTDRYKMVNTDENGRFTITGIIAGDYKVFSWEALEPFGWFDPDVLAQSETKGIAVHVTDVSSETIAVRRIPREGAQ